MIRLTQKQSPSFSVPTPDGLKFMPHQAEAIKYASTRSAVLDASEMGTGKSPTAVGICNADPTITRVLIICPATLKLMWAESVWPKWDVKKSSIGTAKKTFPDTDVVVLNYDILRKFRADIRAREWDLLILDEAHFLKSAKSIRKREVLGGVYRDSEKRIVDRVSPIRAKRRLFLTGTPIVNATKDLWNLVRSLDPDGLGANWHKFASRYCGLIELTRRNWKTGKDEHVGWKWDGAENLDELQRIMRERFMIRKTKAEVLTDLPSKTRTVILLEGNKSLDKLLQAEKMEYDKFKSSDEDLDLSFETLSQLRREVGEAKVPFVVKYIEEILNEVPKVCIFCRHHSVIDRIATAFGTACVVLDGRTTTEDRQRNVTRFQNDPAIQVFVGSISAAGVGITLTSASVAVFAELEWTPSAISQAEDRLWRYGQKNAVTVIHLILRGSLDEHIVNVVMRKQNTVDKVLQ